MSKVLRQKIVFLLFWAGIYGNEEYEHYAKSAYPYYFLLLLLIFERLSQIWIDNRFGCTEEVIKKFEHIQMKNK